MQWQPIETAPKDGIDWILLGYYPAHMDGKQLGGKPRIAFWNGDQWVESGGARLRISGAFSPTHWMPLPEPPAKESRFVQVACWCERCELAANHGMATRMSLCPECGDKRCSRAEFHENQCDKATDTQRTDPQDAEALIGRARHAIAILQQAAQALELLDEFPGVMRGYVKMRSAKTGHDKP